MFAEQPLVLPGSAKNMAFSLTESSIREERAPLQGIFLKKTKNMSNGLKVSRETGSFKILPTDGAPADWSR